MCEDDCFFFGARLSLLRRPACLSFRLREGGPVGLKVTQNAAQSPSLSLAVCRCKVFCFQNEVRFGGSAGEKGGGGRGEGGRGARAVSEVAARGGARTKRGRIKMLLLEGRRARLALRARARALAEGGGWLLVHVREGEGKRGGDPRFLRGERAGRGGIGLGRRKKKSIWFLSSLSVCCVHTQVLVFSLKSACGCGCQGFSFRTRTAHRRRPR